MKNIIKYISVFALAMTILTCNSCKKDEAATDNDEFYIKYKFEMTTLGGRAENILIDYNGEDGRNKQTETKGNFETTIGPVSKGFQASVSAYDKFPLQFEYHLKLNLKIFVSKNNSPFAEKAVNESSDPRTSASLSYTVK
jgi:hypothetical protein